MRLNRADGGFNISLNRRRCQEAPPPPSSGTWSQTPSTMWPLFPSTRTWRAFGRRRRERQVSRRSGREESTTSRGGQSSHSWQHASQIIKCDATRRALGWIVCQFSRGQECLCVLMQLMQTVTYLVHPAGLNDCCSPLTPAHSAPGSTSLFISAKLFPLIL